MRRTYIQRQRAYLTIADDASRGLRMSPTAAFGVRMKNKHPTALGFENVTAEVATAAELISRRIGWAKCGTV